MRQGEHEQDTQTVHKVRQASSEADNTVSTKLPNLQHRPVVVCFGPTGIFIALILAQSAPNPIVLDRAKEVRKRNKDKWGAQNTLNPESNVQFGEGDVRSKSCDDQRHAPTFTQHQGRHR